MAQKLRPKHTLLEVDSGKLLYAAKFPSYDSSKKVAVDLVDVTLAQNDEGELVPLMYPIYTDSDKTHIAGYVETSFVPIKKK